jgi:hypothetical protein
MSEPSPSSNYGFFCDIEEETETVQYYVIRRSDSHEVTRDVTHVMAKSRYAEIHPGYSSVRLCIGEEEEWLHPSTFFSNLKYRAKSGYKKYKHKFRKILYSAIVCSLFIISVYISVFMPIG